MKPVLKLTLRLIAGATIIIGSSVFAVAGPRDSTGASTRTSGTVAGNSLTTVGSVVVHSGGAISMAGLISAAAGEAVLEKGEDLRKFGKSPLPLGDVNPQIEPDPAPTLD